MSNDGLRVIIERRGNDLYWTMTDRGDEHNGKSRGPSDRLVFLAQALARAIRLPATAL